MTAVAYQESEICENMQQNTNQQGQQCERSLEYPNPATKSNNGLFLVFFVKFLTDVTNMNTQISFGGVQCHRCNSKWVPLQCSIESVVCKSSGGM